MIDESRENVLVLENKNNSKELFKIWNIENKINIECSEDDCKNDVNGNAYVVLIPNTENEFILPLCQGCYDTHHNRKNQSISGLNNSVTILGVDKNLLIQYTR